MVKIFDIISANTATFRNHRLNQSESIRGRIIAQVAIALALSLAFYRGLSAFLSGVITVQAVLIGFSFSVMFFLMSSRDTTRSENDAAAQSIEKEIRREKAEAVAGEIFANLSYFNLVCLACLTASLALLLPPLSSAVHPLYEHIPAQARSASPMLHYAGYGLWIATVWCFYFLLIESAYTFMRITTRINFLFEQKLKPR